MSVMVGPASHPAGMGGSQFTMTLCTGLSQTSEMKMGAAPIVISGVWDNPIYGNMVNWDPPISQVIDLLGGIQKGNASIN